MIQLVAFLGNYGKEYEKTRHNVAWSFEDSLPFANKLSWQCELIGRIKENVSMTTKDIWCTNLCMYRNPPLFESSFHATSLL